MAAAWTFPSMAVLAVALIMDSLSEKDVERDRRRSLEDENELLEARVLANREYDLQLTSLLETFRAKAPPGVEVWIENRLVRLRMSRDKESKFYLLPDEKTGGMSGGFEKSGKEIILDKTYEAALINKRITLREVPPGFVCVPKEEGWMGFGSIVPTQAS